MPDQNHDANSHPAQASPYLTGPALDGLPISVWATGQRSAPVQRRGRYLPASTQHPARMLPAIAAHAISVYTRPGDLVLDPM